MHLNISSEKCPQKHPCGPLREERAPLAGQLNLNQNFLYSSAYISVSICIGQLRVRIKNKTGCGLINDINENYTFNKHRKENIPKGCLNNDA